VAAPTFVREAEVATWDSETENRATATQSVATGDVVLDLAAAESGAISFNTPANTLGLTFSPLEAPSTNLNATEVAAFGAVAPGDDASGSVTIDHSGSGTMHGHTALTFADSDGIGESTGSTVTSGSGAPGLGITTTQDNSAIAVLIADWNASDLSSPTWRQVNGSGPTQLTYFRNSSRYTVLVAYYADAGPAGAKTVGISAPTTGRLSQVAVEVLGTAGGGTVEDTGGAASIDVDAAAAAGLRTTTGGAGAVDVDAAAAAIARLAAAGAASVDVEAAAAGRAELNTAGAAAAALQAAMTARLERTAAGTASVDVDAQAAGKLELPAAGVAGLELTAAAAAIARLAAGGTAELVIVAVATPESAGGTVLDTGGTATVDVDLAGAATLELRAGGLVTVDVGTIAAAIARLDTAGITALDVDAVAAAGAILRAAGVAELELEATAAAIYAGTLNTGGVAEVELVAIATALLAGGAGPGRIVALEPGRPVRGRAGRIDPTSPGRIV
jgi:hypothetical protein